MRFPCLLDRIVSCAKDTPPSQRTIAFRQYREAVFRDLHWLLNNTQVPRLERAFPRFPLPTDVLHERENELVNNKTNPRGLRYVEVRRSVFNYGIPSLSGTLAQGMQRVDLDFEREIKEAITVFEPRLSRVAVKLARDMFEHGKLEFEVHADLWAGDYAEPIRFHYKCDWETGKTVAIDKS